MPMKKFVMVELTEDEYRARSLELAEKEIAKADAEEAKRASAAAYNVTIGELRDRLAELAPIVKTRKESREREVIERKSDTVNGSIEVVDAKTGEIVEVQPEGEKRSGPLFKGVGSPKAAKKGDGSNGAGKKKPKPEPAASAPGAEFSTGEPGIGIGTDGLEYELDVKAADEVRNGKSVHVQGKTDKGLVVEIVNLKRIKKGAKENGAAQVHP